jgi:hypothetical protein
MVTITLHCPHCQSEALVRHGHAPKMTSGFGLPSAVRRVKWWPMPWGIGANGCASDCGTPFCRSIGKGTAEPPF